jgi:hypothetical protein
VRAHRRKMYLFLALSLGDFALTWLLLNRGGGAYESNPAAAWWLEQFGWFGLVSFKLGMCAVAMTLISAVSRRNPHAAGRILFFACSALLAVVAYSGSLVPKVFAQAEAEERIEARNRKLDNEITRSRDYYSTLIDLRDELLAEHCGLFDAVAVLMETERVREPQWYEGLSSAYPGYSKPELVAIRLLLELQDHPTIHQSVRVKRIRSLRAQFAICFGRPVPEEFFTSLLPSKDSSEPTVSAKIPQ